MKENVGKLGIRNDQLFVGGESAGGGLTAALTLYARDKGEVNIAFQIPLYPMLDDRMNTNSAKDNNAPVWDSENNAVAWKMYLGDLYDTEKVPKYAAAARETDYSGLSFDTISGKSQVSKTAIEKLLKEYVYAVEHYFAEQNNPIAAHQ